MTKVDWRWAGVDEAGRGPLAGPVVVAAVVLRPATRLPGLTDSKRLTARSRERLYRQIMARAAAASIVAVNVPEIDRINIYAATLTGMARAIRQLSFDVAGALIDGNAVPADAPCPTKAVIGGDGKVRAISAASVLAKVFRDRLMAVADRSFPQYGFAQHKGYGVPAHLEALREHGPCALHRQSFAPVRAMMPDLFGTQVACR